MRYAWDYVCIPIIFLEFSYTLPLSIVLESAKCPTTKIGPLRVTRELIPLSLPNQQSA